MINPKVFAAVPFFAFATPLLAQDAPGEWTYKVAPYLWATGLKGTAATIPGAPAVDVDASFSDLLDSLDAALMVVGHASNGRFGISGDLQYYKLSTDRTGPLGGAQADVRIRETIATVTGDYKLSEGPGYELWGQAGIRYWNVESEIQLTGPGDASNFTEGSDNWVDPVIGFRGRTRVGDNGFLTGWAYLGGFGAGSDEMVDLFGGYGYQFTPTTSAVLGYRYMSVDRDDNGFVFDMEQSGPMLGVLFEF